MALHEDFDNTQDQLLWLKHLDKERQHLSASVEETLADPSSSQQDQWDDDGLPPDTSQKTALIPPRLSLQSRVLPVVGAARTEQSPTGTHQAIASSQEPHATEAPQGQNVFKRIAQRLTAVFGSSDQHEAVGTDVRQGKGIEPVQPRRSQTALLPAVSPTPSIPRMPSVPQTSNRPSVDTMPTMPPLPTYTPNEWTGGPKPTVVDAVPSVRQPAIPVRSSEMADAETDTGKQKLAGWNTKVRLQAVSLPSRSAMIATRPIEEVDTKPDPREVREPLDSSVHNHTRSGQTAQIGVSRATGKIEEVRVAKPAQEQRSLQAGNTVAGRGSLSGMDAFESGQSEYAVKNTNITATSVVQVMLSSNPGPVALHYVSLQPQVGFTIHLTGPATMKTGFNYVILLSELF